jgi:hypothetical protein
MEYRFFEFFHKFSYGDSKPKIIFLPKRYDDGLIEEYFIHLKMEYYYSDKYRGISYKEIPINDLTKEYIENKIDNLKNKIDDLENKLIFFETIRK